MATEISDGRKFISFADPINNGARSPKAKPFCVEIKGDVKPVDDDGDSVYSGGHSAFVAPEVVDVRLLRVTQPCVGNAEVNDKIAELTALVRDKGAKKLKKWKIKKRLPVVAGPGGELYLVDHHHAARAVLLCDEIEDKTMPVHVLVDWSSLSPNRFMKSMLKNDFIFPYACGKELNPHDKRGGFPAKLSVLGDDPLRSVVRALRDLGVLVKETAPFAEFRWANKLRPHLSAVALAEAKALKTAHLPLPSRLHTEIVALVEQMKLSEAAAVDVPVADHVVPQDGDETVRNGGSPRHAVMKDVTCDTAAVYLRSPRAVASPKPTVPANPPGSHQRPTPPSVSRPSADPAAVHSPSDPESDCLYPLAPMPQSSGCMEVLRTFLGRTPCADPLSSIHMWWLVLSSGDCDASLHSTSPLNVRASERCSAFGARIGSLCAPGCVLGAIAPDETVCGRKPSQMARLFAASVAATSSTSHSATSYSFPSRLATPCVKGATAAERAHEAVLHMRSLAASRQAASWRPHRSAALSWDGLLTVFVWPPEDVSQLLLAMGVRWRDAKKLVAPDSQSNIPREDLLWQIGPVPLRSIRNGTSLPITVNNGDTPISHNGADLPVTVTRAPMQILFGDRSD